MNYLLIENKGEIDINALILMGGSTKRDDKSAIGFFGSGNKYAIALLLKKGIGFKIFSGERELKITTKNVKFRDKEFDQILINGQETSLTTDMGPQWEDWMVVREFLSNSIDEGNHNVINSVEYTEGKNGYTRIYIEHSDSIKELINDWDNYFSFDRTDALIDTPQGKIFPHLDKEQHQILFRRGIRCYKSCYQTLFQYDLPNFPINESRVVDDTYTAEALCYNFLAENATIEVASKFLNLVCKSENFEQNFYWHPATVRTLSPVWKQAIGNHILIVFELGGWFMDEAAMYPHYYVTNSFARVINKFFPEIIIYGLTTDSEQSYFKKCETQPKVKFLLETSLSFLQEAKYDVKYPIEIGEFSKPNQLGGIGNNTIQLSTKVFDMGKKEIVMTIIEENEHLNTKFKDKTLEFQNHFIRLFVTEMETRIGNFL